MGTIAGRIRVTEIKLTSHTARSTGSPIRSQGQMAGVDSLVHDHARIVAQLPVELSMADIEGVHAGGSVLQQAIGEAAGGCAEVQADLAGRIDFEMLQRGLQLEAAPANESRAREDFDAAGCGHALAGLLRFAVIDQNLAGHDEGLRFFPGIGQTAVQEQEVEPLAAWS